MTKTISKVFSLLTILALMLAAMPVQGAQAAPLLFSNPTTTIFINEIHYDNTGTDAGEAIEVAGPAGTDLTGWNIVLYNGSGGAVYDTDALSGVIPNQQGGYGTVVLNYPSNGIQNGAPDGIALVNGTTVVQFLSYEGTFTAVGGPANGMTSTDIGVSQVGTEPVGSSLQLAGTGSTYGEFTWTATISNTFGNPNTGQVFGVPEPTAPVINEFSASTAGTDVEYVEIYGDPNTDYSANTVLEIEGDTTGSGVVDEVIALGTTDANGLYLANLPANALENGTISLLIVKNFTGALNVDLDTDNDGVFDTTPWDSIVDSVAVNDGGAGDVTYGTPALGVSYDGQPFAPGGASRIPDGFDTDVATDWVRNDFDLEGIIGFTGTPIVGEAYNTPGALNAVVLPPAPQLVINEVDYDQPSSDAAEFVEIKNNGSSAVSLNGWTLELVNGNGGGAALYNTITLPNVSLAAGDYYVVCANAATVANCDLDASPNTDFIQNGAPDAVGLRYNGDLMDAVSYEGNTGAPYTEGSGVGLTDTAAGVESISRCIDGTDTNVNNVDFSLRPITPGAANSCVVADAAPEVTSTYPTSGMTDFPVNSDLTVTFSEPVNVTGAWFELSCSTSGLVGATVSGGPTTFTMNPATDLVGGESCTLTVYAANVSDQDSNDPPDNLVMNFTVGFSTLNVCALTYTPIYDIQGSGPTAAITGAVSTQGIVVGDYEGASPTLRGFYIQDAAGDADTTTSDAIFVFNGNNNSVNLGDVVRVTGTAAEFQDQTQISASSVVKCGTGTVAPIDVTFPVPSLTYLEQFEGMLVRMPQTMYVTEHFQLGRFGQVLLSSGGRLQQPTNIVLPGAPAIAMQNANNLNKIILDDALQNQNPDPILFGRGGLPLSASNTLRGGDMVTGVVGIMTYTWSGNAASGNAYRLRPINALGGGIPDFQPANPRPTSAPDVGGTVKVVGMNLLNFFNTFNDGNSSTPGCFPGGGDSDCRGASNAVEFQRQYVKTVAAIVAMDPDVIGVNEIENDGYGPDSSLQFLVDQLNAATAPETYSFIDVDADTGQVNAMGTDAIRVALLYKPGVVTPVGQTAPLNSVAFVNGGDPAPRNRVSLAQAFQVNDTGAVFIVNVNHLKSKGSACTLPDQGDGQGNCNQVRLNAVNELMSWLATDPTGTGDPDVVLVGDYNSYAMEDPIIALQNGGFTHLIKTFLGPDAYSYVFDGQWGYLDHALASASLTSQVTGVADYHINADEPSVLDYLEDFKSAGQLVSLYAPDQFRVSDHDPVVVGLDLINYAPELGEITVSPELAAVGATVNANVSFTDADKLDTHAATIDWGDGTIDAGTITEANGSGTITGSHAYATPGIYTVTVTMDDGYGNTDTAVYEFVVVYDPNGGFVTGGGWINSPAGAYIADPSLAGKATFGFVAKYQKGANVPVGNTEFQFKTGNLNFKSTSYEWLVVAGSKAQFKGEGTINGDGLYKFMITAVDGSPDTFRIKIWTEDGSGEQVVYDNGSQQALGGGSIVVHK